MITAGCLPGLPAQAAANADTAACAFYKGKNNFLLNRTRYLSMNEVFS
jgi:hypothetical protein